MREFFGRRQSFVPSGLMACALFVFLRCAAAADASPVPSFLATPTGGTPPVTVTFDATSSYLPNSPVPGQTYFYQAVWDFGDGNTLTVPATGPTADKNVALSAPPNPPVQNEYFTLGVFTVKLTLSVFIPVYDTNADGSYKTNPDGSFVFKLNPDGSYVFTPGPSAFSTQIVHCANENHPPVPQLGNLSSEPDGTLPYTLTITAGNSMDDDGYILWTAIDWGDGASQVVPNPPTLPAQSISHQYTTAGIFKVTLSVVDNGRIPLPGSDLALPSGTDVVVIPTFNNAADPNGALAFYRAYQSTLPLVNNPFGLFPQYDNVDVNPAAAQNRLDEKFDPILRQNFLFVQIPGNVTALKGNFKLDFKDNTRSTLDLTMKLNAPLPTLAEIDVGVAFGSGSSRLTIPLFTTNSRGQYKAPDITFTFAFDRKKQVFRIKLKDPALMAALRQTVATVVNGNVDLPVLISINGTLLRTTVRFAYNAKVEKGGTGKLGISYPRGN